MSAKLPEFVYLVTLDNEWPVSAIAGDHPSTAELVAKEVARRTSGHSPPRSTDLAKVWRVRVTEAEEMTVVPERRVAPALELRPAP